MARELYNFPEPENRESEKEIQTEEDSALNRGEEVIIDQKKIELLKSKVDSIVEKIEDLKPEKINPHWIFNNCGGEYDFVKTKFRTLDGNINWQVMVDLLPGEQRAKWSFEEHRKWNMQKAKRIAVEMLEKDNPVTFNANWLRVQDRGLYKHLRRKLKNQDSGEIEWDKFINQLPEKWMERWVTGMRAEKREQMSQDRMKFTFLSAIERLNLLLEENTPGSFSSTDVESYDEQLYSYFKRHVAKEGGGIDWEKIMSGVDEKYRKRFNPPKIFDEVYPDEQYEDEPEVDKLVEENKDKLLTFFGVKNKNDKDKRNEICMDLIRLAKKGNLSAEKKLVEYLEIVANQWIEKDKIFDVYKIDTEDLRGRIKRSIYLFREKGVASFVGYLYVNLREQAKGLNRSYKKIELDSPANEKKQGMEKHETTDLSRAVGE